MVRRTWYFSAASLFTHVNELALVAALLRRWWTARCRSWRCSTDPPASFPDRGPGVIAPCRHDAANPMTFSVDIAIVERHACGRRMRRVRQRPHAPTAKSNTLPGLKRRSIQRRPRTKNRKVVIRARRQGGMFLTGCCPGQDDVEPRAPLRKRGRVGDGDDLRVQGLFGQGSPPCRSRRCCGGPAPAATRQILLGEADDGPVGSQRHCIRRDEPSERLPGRFVSLGASRPHPPLPHGIGRRHFAAFASNAAAIRSCQCFWPLDFPKPGRRFSSMA